MIDQAFCANYARVSTADQAERQTPIETQLERCREFAARRGLAVAAELVDAGYSGAVRDRPGLDRLLELVRGRGIGAVIVWDYSRLARDTELFGWIRWEFRREGVEVLSVCEGGSSPLETDIRAAIHAEQRRKVREDVIRTMRSKAGRGEYTGGRALYGYRWVDRTTREVVPAEAAVVLRIFDAFAGGQTKVQISAETGLDRQRIHRILRHPGYAGAYTYGRAAAVPGKRNQFRQTDRAAWVVRWDAHPAIVPRELFEAAQDRLDALQRRGHAGPARGQQTLPLSGLLACSACGADLRILASFVDRQGRRRHYYGCGGAHPRHRDRGQLPACDRRERMTVMGWPERLLGHLARELAAQGLAEQIAAAMREAHRAGREEGRLEAELRRLERSERDLVSAIASGLVPDPRPLAAQLGQVQRSHQAAQDALRAARASLPPMSTEAVRELLAGAARDLEAIAGHPRVEQISRDLLRRYVERVIVDAPAQRAEVRLRWGLRGWIAERRMGAQATREYLAPSIGWELPRRVA